MLRNRLRSCSRGNVLLVAAGSLPLVLGAAGISVDVMQWVVWKRQLQRQADSASMAGAFAVAQGKDGIASATSDLARTGEITLSATPVITTPPTSGSHANDPLAVSVTIETRRKLPFTGLFMRSSPTIDASSTAAAVSNGQYCVIALDKANVVGITMQGNATLRLGCGMASNTKSANAVSLGGSSSVQADPVAAVGGLLSSDRYLSPTTLLPYSIPQRDPFATLPTPAPSGCSGQVTVGPNSSRSLSAGCYRGMDVKGTLSLQPGVYYIDGGSFNVGSQAVLTGTGVTIILTSSTASASPSTIATVSINGGATIRLSAPTSGTYKGVIFYQDRRATDTGSNLINGNAGSFFQGALYFPSQPVEFTGTAGMSSDCLQFVAKRLSFSGNSAIVNSCPSNSGSGSFIGTRVRLVG